MRGRCSLSLVRFQLPHVYRALKVLFFGSSYFYIELEIGWPAKSARIRGEVSPSTSGVVEGERAKCL